MAKSRIGESYLQIIPVVGDFSKEFNKQLNTALGNVDVDEVGDQIGEDLGESIGDTGGKKASAGMGKTLVAGIAALGLGAIIGDSIAKGLEGATATNRVSAALNLTSEEAQKVAGATAEIYKGAYGESTAAVAESMQAIVGSIKGAREMSQEELAGMGADMDNLTSTFGLDASMVAQTVQSMIGTGLAADWDEATSIILAGYQTMGASGEDWIESLNEFSDDFVQLGLTGEQGIQLVNAAIEAGIKDTDAFVDGLQEMGIKIADFTADESLISLGLDPDEIRKQMEAGGEQASAAFQNIVTKLQESGDRSLWAGVFGTKAEDYAQAFQNFDMSNFNAGLADGIGNMEKFDETLAGDGQASLTAFQRTIESAFVETLAPILAIVTPLLAEFVGWIQENEEAATALAILIGGILLLAIVGLTVALWGMVAPVLANPITWIILAAVAAIALLVAAIWMIASNWEGIVAGISGLWSGFIDWIIGTMTAAGEFFTGFGNAVGNFFIGIVNNAIRGINFLISLINGIQFSLPDWLGGMSFGFNIPTINEIPALAEGATVNPTPGGTIARLAEAGRAETVVDEGLMNENLRLQNEKLAGADGGGTTIYNVYQQPGESTEELVRRIDSYKEFNELRPGYNFNG